MNNLATLLATALLEHPDLPAAIARALLAQHGQLRDVNVAAMLGVSRSTVRGNPQIMALSRDLPGVGRRWAAEDVRAWCESHPRGVRKL